MQGNYTHRRCHGLESGRQLIEPLNGYEQPSTKQLSVVPDVEPDSLDVGVTKQQKTHLKKRKTTCKTFDWIEKKNIFRLY